MVRPGDNLTREREQPKFRANRTRWVYEGGHWSKLEYILEVPRVQPATTTRVTAVQIVRLLCDKTFYRRDRGILDCAYSALRPVTRLVPSEGFGVGNRRVIGLVSFGVVADGFFYKGAVAHLFGKGLTNTDGGVGTF